MKNKNISVTSNENWCWVYLIRSKKYNETYIGSTNDLSRRLFEHNDGTEISTKRYRPWQLVYYEAYRSEKDAREREMKLKSHGNAVRELKKRIQRSLKNDKRGLPSTIFRKNGAGFTFIELVIVILLIGILVAALAPRLFRQADSFKIEATAEQIANHIRLAQSRAIAQHITHGVYFGTGTETYSVYSKWDSETDPIYDPLKLGMDLEIDFDTDPQLKGVTIESAQFPTSIRYSVEFNTLGAPNYSGYVNIAKGSETRNIGVAAETGAVSIWE